jgi:hypothetical protein
MRGLLVLTAIALRCATLAETAGGDQNSPSAGVGPFRKFAPGEIRGSAPYVLDDKPALYREPAALADANGVSLYLVMHDAQGHDVIGRTSAADGRTFFGAPQDVGHKPKEVLASDQTWEGADLAFPSVLSVVSGVWLYYVSGGAVGLARSTDGLTFTKGNGPVFVGDSLGPIVSASVAQLSDGTFRMMFAQGASIYEAASPDGLMWQRLDADPSTSVIDPVLAPALGAPRFDTLSVGAPCLVPRMTAAGRLQVRVLYTGLSQGEAGVQSAIGFAARYGDSGALTRATAPVYSVSKHESRPALYEQDGVSLLYVEQDSSDATYRAIAGAVSPPTITLPPTLDYPSAP